MRPQRRQQLLAFLAGLGLDLPAAADPPAGLAPIEEALSHSSAGRPLDHERLEFLGDAVLRLAAAEFLQQQQPPLSVGQCAALRAQIVSDRWLAELGETCGIAAVLHLGPTAVADQVGRATVLAESCEALIGGLYEAWGGSEGGLAAVHRWLTPHWQRSLAELQADPHLHNWKSALQEWSQARGLGLPRYHCEECSRRHGDPRRFRCQVSISPIPAARQAEGGAMPSPPICGEGWGGSRRQAEQQAARAALDALAAAAAP